MNSLILYSTGCPNCNLIKKMLMDKHFKYIENNSVDDMLSLGITQVPVLYVSGKLLNYREAKEWIINNRGDTQ